ncbi:MAG: nucleoside deaminase [Bacteroidota bacterium]|nr:nucleoside deaminase [Bacteroidota bacterium]
MVSTERNNFLKTAIDLSFMGSAHGHGGPFGALVVKDGKIIGKGFNRVLSSNDPTAHAEIVAIREACNNLGSFQLTGCEIYSSCEPCPMCLGAIYWARPDVVFFASTRQDAAGAGFDDAFIYDEIVLPYGERSIPMNYVPLPEALEAFEKWKVNPDKTLY